MTKRPELPLLEIPVNRVMGIDPGNINSGWVLYDHRSRVIDDCGHTDNEMLIRVLPLLKEHGDVCAIESMTNQGKRVGASTFDACWWGGRFFQECITRGIHVETITRAKSKGHVLKMFGGNDSEIQKALTNLHGKEAVKGWKSHHFAALAVARTFAETRLPVIPF